MARRARLDSESDEVVFAVCERFLRQPDEVLEKMARELSQELGRELSRQDIYARVREGVRRGFILLSPPLDQALMQRLGDRYAITPERIRVVPDGGKATNELAATTAAEVVLNLIKETGQARRRVHVGLGSGWTTMHVARRLVQLIRRDPNVPPLALHALSSGFDVHDPLRAPTAFFSLSRSCPSTSSSSGSSRRRRYPGVCTEP